MEVLQAWLEPYPEDLNSKDAKTRQKVWILGQSLRTLESKI